MHLLSARGECIPTMLPPNYCRRIRYISCLYFLAISIKWFPDLHGSERERARDPERCICKLATRTDAISDGQSDPGPLRRLATKCVPSAESKGDRGRWRRHLVLTEEPLGFKLVRLLICVLIMRHSPRHVVRIPHYVDVLLTKY